MNNRIQMGVQVRDVVTGFVGFVTGRANYITGCEQILAQPAQGEDGKFVDARWFDETRLIVTDAAPVVVHGAQHDNGAGDAAPIK